MSAWYLGWLLDLTNKLIYKYALRMELDHMEGTYWTSLLQGLSQWKAMDFWLTVALPTSFSTLLKASFFPCQWGIAHCSPSLQTSNFSSLLILHKPIFTGEISGSLFVLDKESPDRKTFYWKHFILMNFLIINQMHLCKIVFLCFL